ncbi:hypothetical protein FHT02_003823 [Sphingomonas xinjiangensis]|uniref:Uncharacterized protein n=1 Tax=Sphingomonas xinjiangensis TaxID=643568 RepID=A0A840YSC7_9SPHN|nr:hypothetical protein [Sphingomonas xinjiangensis]
MEGRSFGGGPHTPDFKQRKPFRKTTFLERLIAALPFPTCAASSRH